MAAFVAAFGALGVFLIIHSIAATPTASVESENGAISGNASNVLDGSASGGGAIKFGSGAAGGPGQVVASFSTTYWSRWSHGPSSDPNFFPIAVFDNDPYYNDSLVKAAGVNLYLGLYDFNGQYAHYVTNGLVAHNSYAMAGEDIDAETIKADATGGSHIWGYQPADEAEMKGYDPADIQTWVDNIRAHDTTRPVYVGYGKGLAIPQPESNIWLNGHSQAEYCAVPDVVAADFYGPQDPQSFGTPNDPYNGPTGQWVYGKTIDLMRAACGPTKPVWHYVEAEKVNAPGEPGADLPAPTAAQIKQNAWLGIVHGANGLIYFCHDFSVQATDGSWDTKCLQDPQRTPAITQLNAQITSYAAVLNSPTRANAVTVSGNTSKVTTLVKYLNGFAYIFAIADGDATHQDSGSTAATFHVDKLNNATVQLPDESRSLTASGGSFSDNFTPFQLHVYKIAM